MITIHCAGIFCSKEIEVENPPGWHGDGYSEELYCDDCKIQADFFNVVCQGCAGGFSDCSLGKAYAYSYSPGLTKEQCETLKNGYCPFRVSGIIITEVKNGKMKRLETVDISHRASKESAKAVLEAIQKYYEEYIVKPKLAKIEAAQGDGERQMMEEEQEQEDYYGDMYRFEL